MNHRMEKNRLVMRASPDWLNFDIEKTRPFLASFRLPETLIIDFDALWRRHFRDDYRTIRARLKALAVQTYNDVRQASFVHHADWHPDEPLDGWISFLDDDDWMSPALFESLPAPQPRDDGALWGSLRLGRVFAANGYAESLFQFRALDRTVYTNNYAVTAPALQRLGWKSLFEHDGAQTTFDRADFRYITSSQYLSCAVKHPCCTMSINYLMNHECFRADPRREMTKFMEALEAVSLDELAEWLKRPFQQFQAIMADVIPVA